MKSKRRAPAVRTAVRAVFLTALLCAAGGCDILRGTPFQVVSWSPGAEYAPLADGFAVRLTFSAAPDRGSVEKAFTLTEDGTAVRGAFVWEDKRTFRFDPYAGFRENREYRAALSAEARSVSGLSMDDPFDKRFFTRAEGERPRLLSISPADGTIVEDERGDIVLVFSAAVDGKDCRDHVSISPSVSGSWSVDASGFEARFRPAENWENGREYVIDVSADMTDRNRIRTGQAYRSRFQIGGDRTPPVLTGAYAVDALGSVRLTLVSDDPADTVFTENPLWESPWRLRIEFSEEIDFASLDSRLGCENGPALERMTTSPRGYAAVYRLVEKPKWNGRFVFRLSPGVSDGRGNAGVENLLFRILADGAASRPPRLVGIRLPLAPGGADEAAQELTAFAVDAPFASLAVAGGAERYPLNAATSTRVELYFSLADGAALDRFSIMESFRVEATNGALSFSPRAVRTDSFRYADPYAPWAACARAEVEGYLTNQTGSGVVSFSVGAGLTDSAGNASAESVVLPLLK